MKEKRNSYSHFSDEERLIAYPMRARGISLRKICNAIGRAETAAGSLSKEFKRNEPVSPIIRLNLDSFELVRYANEKAKKRREIARKNYKLASDLELKAFVEKQLEDEQASPRDICWRVKKHFSGSKSISHPTIYDHTKRNRGLIKNLRRKGVKPKQRVTKRRKPKDKSVTRRNISERSSLVASRSEFGNYEVDTIHSCKNGSGSAALSIRELKSRKRWFSLLADLKAETTLAVLRGFFRLQPEHMRRTLTVDLGPENKNLYQLEEIFPGFKVYDCDPYSSWQRGAVENANGEFRWYFPKGTDFKNVSSSEIWEVQDKLNRRCMDCLGGKTADEVFEQALNNPPRIQLAGTEVLFSREALFEAVGLRFERSSNLYLPLAAPSG